MNKEELNLKAHSFLNQLSIELEGVKVFAPWEEIDHICYRVESEERYIEIKNELKGFSELLIATPINGREISSFKLYEPIEFNNASISVIELPMPKKGSLYNEGFEHAEFVIDESFEVFINRHKHLKFNTSHRDKKINPDISLRLSDEIQIKFHHNTLEKIIEAEKELINVNP